jgi:hypothetical protein
VSPLPSSPLQLRLRVNSPSRQTFYVEDAISPDGFGRVHRPLETRATRLDDEIPRLQAELDFLKLNLLSSEEIISGARDLYSRRVN